MGPIQILIVGFMRDDFTGKVLPELRSLSERGFIKIIDLLFAKKNIKGNIMALNESELTADEAARFGSIAGTLIGIDMPADEYGKENSGTRNLALTPCDFGSNVEDIAAVIEKIPKDSSFAVVLIEHIWTIELKETLNNAGGVLLAQGLVSPLALANIEVEMAAASQESVKM